MVEETTKPTTEEELIEQRAEEVRTDVRSRLKKLAPKEPFNRHLHNVIFSNPDFINRVVCVGMELYLGMLNSNGTLPGKTALHAQINKYANGMNEYERDMLLLACYDAMCATNMNFQAKGMMNEKLGRAAGNPKTEQSSLLDEDSPIQ